MAEQVPVLEVRDLQIRFNTIEGVVHAVNSIGFDLYRGETLGIVGESGSGKSVSMLSLLRLIPEPPGEIVSGSAVFYGRKKRKGRMLVPGINVPINLTVPRNISAAFGRNGRGKRDETPGIDLLRLNHNHMTAVRGNQIGFVFQDPLSSLNPLLRVGAQIKESLEHHGIARGPAARTRAMELLDMVGIPDPTQRYYHYPHQFSGGMRQRVMIAIAIACDPDIVIADEPTTALDVTVQAQIVDLMGRLSRELGIAVIWISHDLGVVAGIADRVMVMYGGTIVEEGVTEEVYHHPRHPYTVGLLGALPKLYQKDHELVNIKGTPPNLFEAPDDCPFAARCPWVFERCGAERPRLLPVSDNAAAHRSACWFDLERNAPRRAPADGRTHAVDGRAPEADSAAPAVDDAGASST